MKNLIVLAAILMLFSCKQDISEVQNDYDKAVKNRDNLQQQNRVLEAKISELLEQKDQLKYVEEKRPPKYILKIKIYQTHFTLSLKEHIKDKMNAFEVELPVDKGYFDSLNIDDQISEEFRYGSLLFRSSIGDWNIKVIGKRIG